MNIKYLYYYTSIELKELIPNNKYAKLSSTRKIINNAPFVPIIIKLLLTLKCC